jgi:hypothetical protein
MSDLDILVSLDFDAIKSSGEYTMLLLRTYSKFFLNGGQPSTCTGCMRDYHNKIIMKKDIIKEVSKRTCIPAWDGLKYVPAVMKGDKLLMVHKHINSEFLTDKEALELLSLGVLKKDDFKKMPEKQKVVKKEEVKESSN